MANLLLKDQILVLSRQTATRAAVDFINIPSNRAATLQQAEVVLFYFRKDTTSGIHTSVIVINITFMLSTWMDISHESVLACC